MTKWESLNDPDHPVKRGHLLMEIDSAIMALDRIMQSYPLVDLRLVRERLNETASAAR